MLTYQHHVIDVAGGFGVALLCYYLDPGIPQAGSRSPPISASAPFMPSARRFSRRSADGSGRGACFSWPASSLTIVQSQAMGGGGSATQIDTLIAAQKEIINATWNLERRSTAGRSADDLKAVAGAQAELKARAEQIAGGRRGGRGFFPQQIAPPRASGRGPSGDPVGSAIEAMGRAVEQLQGARTADAIPHEMEALQGLLRAQAEIRRRQVMQQSASAAGQGGTSRTDRDLSALFDRELQRQQKTNYEAPQQSSDTPQQEESDLLDRIRELARRQDELAQQQRTLAQANLAAEELKRQLERLSRDQEELRRLAEQLQKQVQAARSAAAGRGRGNTSPSGSDIQRAAEEMRNAATEMQRQNATGAAASAQQAAEALKRLERQVRGSSTDARQRTAGELRLEAQQIAGGTTARSRRGGQAREGALGHGPRHRRRAPAARRREGQARRPD